MGLRVPLNVTSMTFTVSGVKAPVARIISGLTAAEETALSQYNIYNNVYIISTNPSTGAATLKFPAGIITSITINGVVTAVNAAGVSASVAAADVTAFIGTTQVEPFQIGAA